MSEIERLKEIWENIPNAIMQQVDISQQEVISKYMDIFHIGEYFYVIFNTHSIQMEYVDPKVENILGYTPQDFCLQLVMDKIHLEDLPYYHHYEQSAVRFFSQLPQELFFKYKFAYDYRFRTLEGSYKRIHQQIVPIYYFPEGGVRTLAIFTDLTHLNITGIPKLSFIGMQGAPSYYNVHLNDDFIKASKVFSVRELEILSFMVQGLTSELIAQKLHRSINTIRNHRKNILEKSKCENLQELLVKAVREGWV
ncbi:MAG: LuxR C-terminal-related transcriptional regulator [Flavobacteriaceae bacterium]|nr:LuxR C-terminal-related transcriptional regulator [Flavobacteriaceae bacterium]